MNSLSVGNFQINRKPCFLHSRSIDRSYEFSLRADIPNDSNLDIGPAADFSIDAWVKLDSCSSTHSCPADSGVRVIMEKRSFNAPNHYKGYSFFQSCPKQLFANLVLDRL